MELILQHFKNIIDTIDLNFIKKIKFFEFNNQFFTENRGGCLIFQPVITFPGTCNNISVKFKVVNKGSQLPKISAGTIHHQFLENSNHKKSLCGFVFICFFLAKQRQKKKKKNDRHY